jgi:hypothetical protein
MQIRVIKSRADRPLESLEAAAAIAALTFGFRLIPKAEAANFEDYVEELPDGTLRRESVWVFDDSGTVQILGETITLSDFFARFRDLTWCDANPDSPIANARHLHENTQLWRQHFRENPPMVLIRKGQRTLKLRADATEEEKTKWLKLL